MRRFRDQSIRRKLTVFILLASVPVLLVACFTLVGYSLNRLRIATIQNLTSLTDVVADSCAPELAVMNQSGARATLAALDAKPDVTYACLYSNQGRVFAEYVNDCKTVFRPQHPRPDESGYRYEQGHLIVVNQVVLDDARVGALVIVSDLGEFWVRLRRYTTIIAVVLVTALAGSWLLAAVVARSLAAPLMDLVRLARAVSERGDYSLRAIKMGDDEMGELTEGINRMVAGIEDRELKLRESEGRFRQMAETIEEVFWLTDAEKNTMLYISPGYEEIWGRICDSLYKDPRNWLEAIHPDDRDRVMQAALTKQVSGEYDEEFRIVRPDGSIRWIRDRAFPVADEHGKIYRLAGIAEDITLRKEAEATTRKLQERLQGIYDSSADGIVYVDLTGVLVDVNEAYATLTGYSYTELIGKRTYQSITAPEYQAAETEKVEQVLRTGQPARYEKEYIRKDGTRVPVRLLTFLVRDIEGSPVALAAIVRNISDQKVAEAALRAAEEKWRSLVENSREIIFMADREGTVSSLNRMVPGITVAEVIGRKVCDFIPAESQQIARDALEKTFTTAQAGHYEVLGPGAHGATAWYDCLLVPVKRGERVDAVMVIASDVTERKQADDRLRAAEEKWRSLVENSREYIYIVDQSGTINYLNRTAPGINANEIIGRTVYDFLPADSHGLVRNALEKTFASGEPVRYQTKGIGPQGEMVWYESLIVPIKRDDQVVATMIIAVDITERKQSEGALQESEERFRSFMDNSPGIAWIKDEAGRHVYLSRTFEQRFGVKLDDWRGKTDFELWPAETARIFRENDLAVLRDGKTREVVEASRNLDGTISYWFNFKFLIYDAAGNKYVAGSGIDITERKRVEEALHERDQHLTSIYDTVGDAIFELAVENEGHYRFTSVNQTFLAVTGLTSAQVVGKRVHEVIPEPSLTMVLEKYAAAIRAKGLVRWEETSDYPTGRLTGEVSIAPVFDEDGRCTHLVGGVHDITERKRMEEALRNSEKYNRQLFERSPIGLAVCRMDGKLVDVNEAYAKILGRTVAETLPLSYFDVTPEKYMAQEQVQLASLQSTGRYGPYEKEYIHKDGRLVPVRLTGVIIEKDGERFIWSIVEDITDRKRMERAVLEISDREQTRIGQDMHDSLCQQLVGTLFAVNNLEQKLKALAGTEAVDLRRIGQLIDDATTQARRMARGLYPVTLETEGLCSALGELAVSTSELFSVQCSLDCPEPIHVRDLATGTHLYRIAQEAVNNAIKHGHAKVIAIRLINADNQLTLTIMDDGGGIAANRQGATGLGLHIMEYRTRMIGGRLEVRRNQDRGTIVQCVLGSSVLK